MLTGNNITTDLASIAIDYCGIKPIAQWAR
jgi:hypothetical protein